MWWCCSTCEGNYLLLKEKWLSHLFHITNVHNWDGYQSFHTCGHTNDYSYDKQWLSPSSAAYIELKKIATNDTFIKDLKHLTEFKHSGNIEVFNSLLLKYLPKRIHFSMKGMIARTEIAILDFNSGASCEQAETKSGKKRFKLQYWTYQ